MKRYDRHQQDVGNIVMLEHVNVRVPDQRTRHGLLREGLGFTRDPYLMVGVENMWINMGQTQFHLPTGEPQAHARVTSTSSCPISTRWPRGSASVKELLAGTKFAYSRRGQVRGGHAPVGQPPALLRRRTRSSAT